MDLQDLCTADLDTIEQRIADARDRLGICRHCHVERGQQHLETCLLWSAIVARAGHVGIDEHPPSRRSISSARRCHRCGSANLIIRNDARHCAHCGPQRGAR